MRGLNECLCAFSALLSNWYKFRRRCCPSNYLTGLEFHETRHTDGRDLERVHMTIRLLMYQNQYNMLYVKKYFLNSA